MVCVKLAVPPLSRLATQRAGLRGELLRELQHLQLSSPVTLPLESVRLPVLQSLFSPRRHSDSTLPPRKLMIKMERRRRGTIGPQLMTEDSQQGLVQSDSVSPCPRFYKPSIDTGICSGLENMYLRREFGDSNSSTNQRYPTDNTLMVR
jgi:hypothetical protein